MLAARSGLPILALSLALIFVVGCTSSAPPAGPPSILLVTVDGLRPETVGALGGTTPTPALERLVRDGAGYSDVWTVTPLTRPAVATYLTGLTPPAHGVRDDTSTPLAAGTPTLATVLGAAGYATAAFPDSTALGFDSGLLTDFDVVDDPPVLPVGPLTWLPIHDQRRPTAANLEAWLGGVSPQTPALAWVHLSHALMEQLLPADAESRPDVGTLDTAIGGLLDAMKTTARYDDAWIVVAATAGDVIGGDGGVPGPGLSLEPAAIGVPLFVKAPRGVPAPADGALWAPDVATTLAAAAGVILPGAAGEDLRAADRVTTRVRLAWSGAPRDQIGWAPLVAAGAGRGMLIRGAAAAPVRRAIGGAETPPAAADPLWPRLESALASAGMPAAPSVPLDDVRALLEAYGVRLDPVPPGGRRFDDHARRVAVGRDNLEARSRMLWGDRTRGAELFGQVLESDPDHLGARIGLGQLPALTGRSERALEFLRPAAARYPDHPDVLHWLAHAIWGQSVPDAAALLTAVEPFKPQEGDVLYDLACARSLAGELAESEAFLRRAIESGFRFWQSIDGDPDLRNLRESGRFASVMREYRR